jgi:hypothetical protein
MANNPVNELHNQALATIAAAQATQLPSYGDDWLGQAAEAVRHSQKTIAGASTSVEGRLNHHDAARGVANALHVAAQSAYQSNSDTSHAEKLMGLSGAFHSHADSLFTESELNAALKPGLMYNSRALGEMMTNAFTGQVFGGRENTGEYGTPEKLASGVEQLRRNMIEDGNPFPKKVHKAADRAIDAIRSGDMYEAHGHIDKLHEMTEEHVGHEFQEHAEKLQEGVGKQY